MITDEMVAPVGRLFKPHSYRGEMKVDVLYPREIFLIPKAAFFVKIDNILVPFFVESIGGGSENSSFIKFKGINSDVDAAILVNKELFALKSFLAEALEVDEDELEVPAEEYIGYGVSDHSGQLIGHVEDFEEGVEYDYMTVRTVEGGKTVSIPFIDEFIREVVAPGKEGGKGEFRVELPEGFLDL